RARARPRPPRRSRTSSVRSSSCAATRRCRRATSSRFRCPRRPDPDGRVRRRAARAADAPHTVRARRGRAARVVAVRTVDRRGLVDPVLLLFDCLVIRTLWQDQLVTAVDASIAAAGIYTVARLVQRQAPSAALGGLVAVGVAGVLVLVTGRAEDNFIPGFLTNVAYGSAFLISAFAGWSLIGLAAGFLMDDGIAWRQDRRKRRVFFWLAIMWGALFFLRLGVQFPMWLADVDVQVIGTVKLVMGLPLFAPLVAVTWLVVRATYARAGRADPGSDAPADVR